MSILTICKRVKTKMATRDSCYLHNVAKSENNNNKLLYCHYFHPFLIKHFICLLCPKRNTAQYYRVIHKKNDLRCIHTTQKRPAHTTARECSEIITADSTVVISMCHCFSVAGYSLTIAWTMSLLLPASQRLVLTAYNTLLSEFNVNARYLNSDLRLIHSFRWSLMGFPPHLSVFQMISGNPRYAWAAGQPCGASASPHHPLSLEIDAQQVSTKTIFHKQSLMKISRWVMCANDMSVCCTDALHTRRLETNKTDAKQRDASGCHAKSKFMPLMPSQSSSSFSPRTHTHKSNLHRSVRLDVQHVVFLRAQIVGCRIGRSVIRR